MEGLSKAALSLAALVGVTGDLKSASEDAASLARRARLFLLLFWSLRASMILRVDPTS